MGGVPVKHHTKSKVGRRRSQLKLQAAKPFPCPKCRAPLLPHRACSKCGYFARKASRA